MNKDNQVLATFPKKVQEVKTTELSETIKSRVYKFRPFTNSRVMGRRPIVSFIKKYLSQIKNKVKMINPPEIISKTSKASKIPTLRLIPPKKLPLSRDKTKLVYLWA